MKAKPRCCTNHFDVPLHSFSVDCCIASLLLLLLQGYEIQLADVADMDDVRCRNTQELQCSFSWHVFRLLTAFSTKWVKQTFYVE